MNEALTAVFGMFLICLIFAVCLAFYFLPTIIACRAGHKQQVAIFFVNLFLGWSLIGWVGALVWAVVK